MKGLVCQDCGNLFNGHGNRTRCKACQIKNMELVFQQRTEFDKVKSQSIRRDKKKCTACGSREKLTVHHRTPLIQGGSNDVANLITLCFSCHMKAHHG